MNKEELLAQLQSSSEWKDIEFKEAAWAVPKDALLTVSAFANTEGGHLVFGVKQANGLFSISGVTDVDKVQNDFLGQVRDRNKISVFLPIEEHKHDLAEGTVLVFFVPEAGRQDKPVYLDGNPKKAYIRRGGRDDTCTGDELLRFIRDSAIDRFDAEPLDLDIRQCFDEASVRWYRTRFTACNPGKDGTGDDLTFLRKWGFLVERGGVLLPTRAAILVLGADEYVRQVLPRMVVDLQLYRHSVEEYSPSIRWVDRLTVEENLVKAWQAVVDFYFKHGERPFSVDAATLRRDDDPPDYISFREAAVNLLIHQDFGDHTRVPVIRFFRGQAEFFNPGDAFASREQLLDPGDKEVRNPSVVNAFRRIGLSDQGGTGIGAIFDSWRRLGYVPPEIENNKAEKSFRLRLCKEKLMTEAQLLAQASIGVHLSEHEAAVFAYLIRKGQVDLADIKALTGLGGTAALALAQRLAVQVLSEPVGDPPYQFLLAAHLRTRFVEGATTENTLDQSVMGAAPGGLATEQVTEQVSPSVTEHAQTLVQLTGKQWQIVSHADVPRSLTELMEWAGYSQRAYFKAHHLEPLLDGGVLRMTVPDKPRSSKQRYVLTEAGIKLKAWYAQQQADTERTNENDND
ncbi:transcriptional regulator [Burkholderia pseudomallei]|uniref:RNA-binding domain-containing protein n=1 Tax=Burkholderia pseudomallei TaxID=28450 RepID=UPI000F045E87|nr:RNA-binding domain-containing protein [Burkholderia pseudomallei]CAJ5232157.1 transcriptional regulator [Burkholderia pseudomallei]CAJ7564007.1 transcriptional regulator [Burkholderia pseudomallei]CAK0346510.1 transcriptional regulator [Burkholderia pseudomallei]VCH22751.1 transcriptional regulator [Burkholderia pseudomallei]VCH61554.1 transcriptional regulator [Burkholderia pseudomallei]